MATKRGKRSDLWHECSRKKHLVKHLEWCLSSGRYVADQDEAITYICQQKMSIALLENQLQQQEA